MIEGVELRRLDGGADALVAVSGAVVVVVAVLGQFALGAGGAGEAFGVQFVRLSSSGCSVLLWLDGLLQVLLLQGLLLQQSERGAGKEGCVAEEPVDGVLAHLRQLLPLLCLALDEVVRSVGQADAGGGGRRCHGGGGDGAAGAGAVDGGVTVTDAGVAVFGSRGRREGAASAAGRKLCRGLSGRFLSLG